MFVQGELYKYKTNNIFPVIAAVIRLIYWQNGVRNNSCERERVYLVLSSQEPNRCNINRVWCTCHFITGYANR